jgi:hypothetical protein
MKKGCKTVPWAYVQGPMVSPETEGFSCRGNKEKDVLGELCATNTMPDEGLDKTVCKDSCMPQLYTAVMVSP